MCLFYRFPQGSIVGLNGSKELPVEVCFCSNKPKSFTVKLTFLDQNKNKFSVLVCGIADNSIITNQNYLIQNKTNIESDGFDKPTKMTQIEKNNVTILECISDKILMPMLHFLHSTGLLRLADSTSDKFPSHIVNMNGQPVFDLIEV